MWPVMEDIGFYRSVWGASCAMGGLLEEMGEGRFTGVCEEDMWASVQEWSMRRSILLGV